MTNAAFDVGMGGSSGGAGSRICVIDGSRAASAGSASSTPKAPAQARWRALAVRGEAMSQTNARINIDAASNSPAKRSVRNAKSEVIVPPVWPFR